MSKTYAKWTRPHFQGDAETWSETDTAPTLNQFEQNGREVTPVMIIPEPSALAGTWVQPSFEELISFTEGSPARMSVWPAAGPVYPAAAAVSGLNSSGLCESCGHDGSSLKMFPDSYLPTGGETSVSYSAVWPTSGSAWHGESWTRAGSERPSVGVVSTLSDVLETGAVPKRYWVSARAAEGILRRAPQASQDVAPTLDDGARRASVDLPMTAFTLAASVRGSGDGHGNAWNSNYVAATLSSGGHPNSNAPGRHAEDDTNLIMGSSIDEGMARPLVARHTSYRMDMESENFVVADPIGTREQKTWTDEGSHNFRTHNLVEAWQTQGSNVGAMGTLKGGGTSDGNGAPFITGHGVRRLTPLECERLQGFPDGWTEGAADAHRYRMLSNAVNTVVAQWLGHRLVFVEGLWSR